MGQSALFTSVGQNSSFFNGVAATAMPSPTVKTKPGPEWKGNAPGNMAINRNQTAAIVHSATAIRYIHVTKPGAMRVKRFENAFGRNRIICVVRSLSKHRQRLAQPAQGRGQAVATVFLAGLGQQHHAQNKYSHQDGDHGQHAFGRFGRSGHSQPPPSPKLSLLPSLPSPSGARQSAYA